MVSRRDTITYLKHCPLKINREHRDSAAGRLRYLCGCPGSSQQQSCANSTRLASARLGSARLGLTRPGAAQPGPLGEARGERRGEVLSLQAVRALEIINHRRQEEDGTGPGRGREVVGVTGTGEARDRREWDSDGG